MSKSIQSRQIHVRPEPQTNCCDCPVRASALFSAIPDCDLDFTQTHRETQLVAPAKSNLFFEGDQPQRVYTIFSGWMILYQTLISGRRQILRFGLPGDFIGFQRNGNGDVVYSAEALTEATLCAFPVPRLMELMGKQREVVQQLFHLEMRDMNICQHHLLGAGRKTAEEKVAFLLLELFYRSRMQIPEVAGDAMTVDFPLTQDDIADAVGLSKIHVNRVLRNLVKQNLISCERRRLTVIDEVKLTEIAEFDPGILTTQPLFNNMARSVFGSAP